MRHRPSCRALGVSLALVLTVAACGGSEAEPTTTDPLVDTTTTVAAATTAAPETTTTTMADPKKPYGGEAVVINAGDPPTLNPFVPGGGVMTVGLIGQSYLAWLYDIDGHTYEYIPEVVTEFPTVANGGVALNDDGTMTVHYQIRDEAVWSDGVPISGDDFEFTMETMLTPGLNTDPALYETITSIDVGPKMFSYTLEVPTVQYESMFVVIIPKHAVAGSDFLTDWNTTMWPSAGPFVFDTWEQGEFIRVVRNENYWKVDAETGQQLPYLDSVVFKFVADDESTITAFRSREADIINPNPNTGTIETLQALEPEGAIVEVLSGPVWEHLNFQFGPGRLERNERSANHNLNYRKGVAHAVNKDLIVDEILAGQVEPLDSFVESFIPGLSQGAWGQYAYDPEKAIEFLEAAKEELGVEDLHAVFTTTSNNDARVKLSELFVEMFESVGVTYENQLEDSSLYFGDTLSFGRWDIGEWAWVGTPDIGGLIGILDVFDPESPPPGGNNYYHWGTEDSSVVDEHTVRFSEIRDELNATVDERELVPLIQEAERILADQVVVIPLYARLVVGAVWGDEIGGFKHNPTAAGHTWNIEEWYRTDL